MSDSPKSTGPGRQRSGPFANGLSAYRTVTTEEYQSVMQNGLVVLDTNSLLDLYRYHDSTRKEFLALYAALGDRLWIPHHVMFEFLERRTSVLAERASELSSTLGDLNSHIKQYTDRLFEWTNRIGLTPDIKAEKVAIINAAAQRIAREIAELSVDSNFEGAEDTSQDPVLIALEPILNNRLGAPLPPDEMRNVKEEARQRIEDRRPPGYMDAKKKGENAEGDYIIWYEILREASRKRVDVLLVTRDQKEDWWRKEKGQSKGPRPELVAELEAHAGTRLYMLSPPSLSTHAPEPLSASVSEESIQDAKRVSSRAFIAWNIRLDKSDLMEAALKSRK